MTSSPTTSWKIDGEKGDALPDFIFLGSKVTAGSETEKCLLLERKAVKNLDSVLESRDITC